jgi:hypothetical protein
MSWRKAHSHSLMTMRDGLPGIASEEAESKALLLGNAHLLSRTDLGDLALARGLRLRLLFELLGLGLSDKDPATVTMTPAIGLGGADHVLLIPSLSSAVLPSLAA